MKISYLFTKTGRWISDLTVGGSWGRTQADGVQKNLRWFWFDGLFASAHDNIYLNYISLYVLVLGATQAQVGLMSSFSNLTAALLLLPGAFLAERFVDKHKVSLFCVGWLTRFSLLLLVFVPIFFKGASLVWAAILFSVLRDGFANLGYPAWMAVTNDIVPIEGRGRYFGSRNFIMGIAGILITLLAGKIITLYVDQLGYQIALGAAFVMGISSTYSYAHIRVGYPLPHHPKPSRVNWGGLLADLKRRPAFLVLIVTAAVWNFAINVSGPFFNVHMLQDLHFTASEIGLLNVVTVLSALLVQNQLGALSDRLGARRMQLVSMIVIPILPVGWIFATTVWHIALLNILNGVIWAAYNLSYFNLLLEFMPSDKVPMLSAVYQVVVALALAIGALVGSGIVALWGFTGVLVASAAIRWISAGLFGWFVKAPVKSIGDLSV
jgi:MFS family permease